MSDIESLQLFAGIHSRHFGKYFRLLSKRFPFAIYYIIESNEIRIFAVIDCRRDPAWIRHRLLDKFPLDLIFVADLIYFEGPLLSLFRNETGDSFLYFWCDMDEQCNRWMIFRITKDKLKSFIQKSISLKDLILQPVDGFTYLVDMDNNLEYRSIFYIRPEHLPESYVPESDSFFDFDSELDKNGKKNDFKTYF